MDVNAKPLNRSPRAATFPIVTVKFTEPIAAPTLPSPGMFLSTSAVLALGAAPFTFITRGADTGEPNRLYTHCQFRLATARSAGTGTWPAR
jgi:hypothetical protein